MSYLPTILQKSLTFINSSEIRNSKCFIYKFYRKHIPSKNYWKWYLSVSL